MDTEFPVRRYDIKAHSTSELSHFIAALQDGFQWWVQQEQFIRFHSGLIVQQMNKDPDIWDEA